MKDSNIDVIREAQEVEVEVEGESMRARTWAGIRPPKPWDWTITVARGAEILNVKATK